MLISHEKPVGGLIGTATKDKDGLMSKDSYMNAVYYDPGNAFLSVNKSAVWRIPKESFVKVLVIADTGVFKEYQVKYASSGSFAISQSYDTSFSCNFYYDSNYLYIKVSTTYNSASVRISNFDGGGPAESIQDDISNKTAIPVTSL